MSVTLSPDYRPSDDEPFMSPKQREYFRRKLLAWKEELLSESTETLLHLQEGGFREPDLADRASLETDRSLELRTRDRARKLVSKIDEAIERVEDGSYGYCVETGEPTESAGSDWMPVAITTTPGLASGSMAIWSPNVVPLTISGVIDSTLPSTGA